MANIQNIDNKPLTRLSGHTYSHTLLTGMQNDTTFMEFGIIWQYYI